MTDAEIDALVEKLERWSSFGYGVDASTAMREAVALIHSLRDHLCLADELLMEAKGAFPLLGNPLRPAYLKIRAITGDDYYERKCRARSLIEQREG